MKLYLLALVFAIAHAKNFSVTDQGFTCLLLQVDGAVNLTSAEKTVILKFEDAEKLDSSTCTVIKLNLTKSVEVWFEFTELTSGEFEVIPIAQFIPLDVFGNYTNETVTYKADPLEHTFNKHESYQCLADTTLKFQEPASADYNITVTALTSNFLIQSVNESSFVPGVKCKADESTTPVPVTTPPTKAPVTTPQPDRLQDFNCTSDNITRFRVEGYFVLAITYNKTGNKPTTVSIDVPQAHLIDTECTSNNSESLTFKFFDGWSIEYIFQKDGAKYHISNITVTYVHDHHLENSTLAHNTSHAHFSSANYFEATGKTYYTCKAKITLPIDKQVSLITHDFKYKAFNEKGDIKFDGEVTECSQDEDTSSVVPIAVGAALAGLVVIVLIAYLIGRRRSRKAGYESV